MPPYDLPEQASVSGIKSRSLTSTNPEQFNEIRFDDKVGSEKFVIQAQKDLSGTVENDYTLNVSNNSTVTVGGHQSITVDGNQSTTVGKLPLTMNFLVTWNNIELNKLTKSVVSSVSHADVSALNLNTYGIQFTGVGILNAEIDLVKYEQVLTKKWEVCGAKMLHTMLNSTETVGRNQIVSVKNDKTDVIGRDLKEDVARDHTEDVHRNSTLTVGKDLVFAGGRDVTIECKANDLSDPSQAASQLLVIKSANEVNMSAKNRVDLMAGTGVAAQEAQINLADPGKVEIVGQTITFSALDKIILRAPQVVIQGQSDQILYSKGYELVDIAQAENIDRKTIVRSLKGLVLSQDITALELAAIRAFYGI